MTDAPRSSMIFNSALETGLRSLCILEASAPQKLDLQQLLAFDHVVVHSGDIESGPPSLHPNSSHRNGELLVRRPLVTNGLLLMGGKGLLIREVQGDGISYRASELTEVFLNSLTNDYISGLRERSRWAVSAFEGLGQRIFYQVFNTAFDRWTTEFQFSELVIGGH